MEDMIMIELDCGTYTVSRGQREVSVKDGCRYALQWGGLIPEQLIGYKRIPDEPTTPRVLWRGVLATKDGDSQAAIVVNDGAYSVWLSDGKTARKVSPLDILGDYWMRVVVDLVTKSPPA